MEKRRSCRISIETTQRKRERAHNEKRANLVEEEGSRQVRKEER
jgi:hypothetical protein